jgi:PTH1 family peptidyl-tRNA hydrolase
MRLVIGIGNPGAAYADTRHNLGFLVLDELAMRHQLSSWSRRWSSQIAEWPQAPGDGTVALLKPQTFVNASGEAVQAAAAFYKLPLGALLVVVDDLNLPLGTLRLRGSGSAGGHNGLRDIEARLGPGYPRLRLGIGQPAQGEGAHLGHVLGRFAAQEQEPVRAMVARAADCVESWCAGGLEGAARFNGAGTPAAPPGPPPAGRPPGAGPGAPRPPDPAT